MESSNSRGDVEIDGFVDLGQYSSGPLTNISSRKNHRLVESPVTVMVVGKPRNGKSTVLNNIFGVQFEARPSVKPVTRQVISTQATKGTTVYQIIDTPGLGSLEISAKNTLEKMKQVTEGEKFTMMYCFSISPDSLLDETDKSLMDSLHTCLGKDVWHNCIVLLTFSDLTLEEFSSAEMYVDHIKSHAREFQLLLNSLCDDPPTVKTIFECGAEIGEENAATHSTIVAVPVTKQTQHSDRILPGLLRGGQDWTGVVIEQLKKLSRSA